MVFTDRNIGTLSGKLRKFEKYWKCFFPLYTRVYRLNRSAREFTLEFGQLSLPNVHKSDIRGGHRVVDRYLNDLSGISSVCFYRFILLLCLLR